MSNQFNKNLTVGIGTSPTTIYSTNSTTKSTVIGINIANTSNSDIFVDIKLIDENSLSGYLVKGVLVPANQSLAAMGGDQKLVMVGSNSLTVTSSVASSADVIVSVLEIY